MLLPIGDEPRPLNYRAKSNRLLIILNILIFCFISWPLITTPVNITDPLLQHYLQFMSKQTALAPNLLLQNISAYDLFVYKYGFKSLHPEFFAIFVSLFLHSGWVHLLSNMLFLWIFGKNVEYHLGSLNYLALYILGGVAATLTFALFARQSEVPLIGASGAISAVLGCYFVWFPRYRVKLLFVFLLFIEIIFVPARWVLAFYILFENLLPFLLEKNSTVAYGAHIGGFMSGLAYAYARDYRQRQQRNQKLPSPAPTTNTPEPPNNLELRSDHLNKTRLSPSVTTPSALNSDPLVTARDFFKNLIKQEKWLEALSSYKQSELQVFQRFRASDVLALVDHLTDKQRFEEALAILYRFIAVNPEDAYELARAHLRAGYIAWRGLKQPVVAKEHLLAVLELNQDAEINNAANSALNEIARYEAEGNNLL